MTLQYTVAISHSVVEGGLHDAEAQLRALASGRAAAVAASAPAPAAAPPFRLHHYFGVPPDCFNSFSLKGKDFKRTPGKPLPLNVDYYVVMVEDPQFTAHRQQQQQRKVIHSHTMRRLIDAKHRTKSSMSSWCELRSAGFASVYVDVHGFVRSAQRLLQPLLRQAQRSDHTADVGRTVSASGAAPVRTRD